MTNLSRWEPLQTDVLFLLVGTNPLPNYVATCLLAKPRSKIVLLATQKTHKIAKRLQRILKQKGKEWKYEWEIPEPREIDEADASKIYRDVRKLLVEKGAESGSIGLNYTGGTKAMAVHAYRAVESSHPDAVFSYLDANELAMKICIKDAPTQTIPVGRYCTIPLSDLVWLHGYRRPQSLRMIPRAPDLARAILDVHLAGHGEKWRGWTGKGLQALPTLQEYPFLQPVIEQFSKIGNADDVARYLGFSKLASCAKWFIGEWLEEVVADALSELFQSEVIDDYAVDIKLEQSKRGREMQIDAAAMSGYQLFAISCIATHKKEKAKEHLLEVFVRAQQIGGEEARIGLVCLYNKPEKLEKELSESWLAYGKIRVFGPEQLQTLPVYIEDWIRNAS